MNWFIYALQRYSDFSGRSRRKEFWTYAFYYILLAIGAAFLDAILGFSRMNGNMYGPILSILSLVLLIPSIAVAIRRLHDIGKSGWWLLVGFIPFIGFIWLLIYYLREGMTVENEYGPDPKE